MSTSKIRTRASIVPYALFAFASAFAIAACGDDENGDDTPTIPGTGGSRPTGGNDAGGEAAAGAGNEPGTGGTSGGSTGGNTGGSSQAGSGAGGEAGDNAGGSSDGGTGAGGETDCTPQGEYDCYPCEPKSDEQYLNRCSDAECSPFDNAERIPGFTGTLPDL